MTESYLAVAGRIRRELKQVETVSSRAQSIWAEFRPEEETDYRIDAVALNLHGFYAGLERIFDTIARRVDQTRPDGEHWHQELLDQMNTELAGIRPAVLSDSTRKALDRYRGFRHVVRNVYAFEFDPEQMAILMKHLPQATAQVKDDLLHFADTLEDIGQAER